MIPRAEVDALTQSLAEALGLAQAGKVAEGHELLLWGLQQAEAMRDDGAPWGDDLVHYWQWTTADYLARCGPLRGRGTGFRRTIQRHLTSALAAIALFSTGLLLAQTTGLGGMRSGGEGPNLRGARLSAAVLKGVDLGGVDLRGVVLRDAVLAGCSLRRADLTGADMTGADLTGARLDGANLRGARLVGADASAARGLHSADLRNAQYDARTRWPARFDPTARGAVLVTGRHETIQPRARTRFRGTPVRSRRRSSTARAAPTDRRSRIAGPWR